ncbi:MAG TPA: hypothetical protein VJQ25_03690 [Nitrospira sp.]|nr:hypothetical protein [Nitrospira sp.]
MLFYAAVLLVIGLIGHGLSLAGVPSAMVEMSWILVLIGGLLSMFHVVSDFD